MALSEKRWNCCPTIVLASWACSAAAVVCATAVAAVAARRDRRGVGTRRAGRAVLPSSTCDEALAIPVLLSLPLPASSLRCWTPARGS
jgi:hypothetical protein